MFSSFYGGTDQEVWDRIINLCGSSGPPRQVCADCGEAQPAAGMAYVREGKHPIHGLGLERRICQPCINERLHGKESV